ncbi:MAG: PhzF family phenazine biosynthesis protein [Planctomycetota bacterium]
MTPIRIFQVDAFTEQPFAGNPAAVCLLNEEREENWMQLVAAEMNLSETAFVMPRSIGYKLRWFTPKAEVELCGHATLASAHVLWEEGLVDRDLDINFSTKSGTLYCKRQQTDIELNFPATLATEITPPASLLQALGLSKAEFVGDTKYDKLVVVTTEREVRSLKPDFTSLAKLPARGVIVSSTSQDPKVDFISRFFAPAVGINEDPVTGSAHCCLGPYWAKRLNKRILVAYQASERGGTLGVSVADDRVLLSGRAVTVLRGELTGV